VTRLDQIAAAAERLFSAQGYHATSVRQVAREVDLQGGSLYAHIDGKEDVLAAIVDRAAHQFRAAISGVFGMDVPASQRLRAAVQAHLRVITANLPAATVYFHDWRYLSEPRASHVRAQRDEYEGRWRQLIADGVASGEFRPIDPRVGALACLSMLNWTYQWFYPTGPMDAHSVADAFSDVLLNGLSASPTLTTETQP
jgi:AcrR family transcriptional regulator